MVVRAPGAFPLTLQVETPSGDMVLRSGTGSVTSTAISDVGWFLMVGAALFLGAWWVRNARHGRRARQLIPRPDDEPGSADDGPDAPGAAPEDGGTLVPRAAPATADATKAVPMANPTTPGRSGDVTIVTAGPADPRRQYLGPPPLLPATRRRQPSAPATLAPPTLAPATLLPVTRTWRTPMRLTPAKPHQVRPPDPYCCQSPWTGRAQPGGGTTGLCGSHRP